MISKEHKKHAALNKPAYGHFGRNEWAFVGAPCHVIKELADKIFNALSPGYLGAYVDAEHTRGDDSPALTDRLHAGAVWEYSNKIAYQQLNYRHSLNNFQYRQLFSQADVVLVNGNHFEAKAQVVILDPVKKASLLKRLGQLTNVELVLLAGDTKDISDFIGEAVPGWHHLPLFRLEETDKIIAFFKNRLEQSAPPLNGLVLAGGKSVRMEGNDKGAMVWHGKEQRYYVADMLKVSCKEVYISCRPEQQAEIEHARPVLPDTFSGLGPYGAILSAFRAQPDAAWLVTACDLPLLNQQALDFLTAQRDTKAMATTFISPYDGLPEPLITIWEPKSYPILLSFLAQGYSCPRKALINSDTNLLTAPDPDALINVNTPGDVERVKQLIEERLRAI